LAAFLTGHSRPAEFVRHGLATAGDYINGKVGAGQVKPWQLWLAHYRRILDSVIIGIAVLVLIFWQDPTAAVAIWTAVFAVLAVLLVELLCRPAVAPAAEAVVGTGAGSVSVDTGAEPAPGPASGSVTAGGPREKLNPTLPIPRKTDSPED
jgi:uncharacterized MnhB-related membrane protein